MNLLDVHGLYRYSIANYMYKSINFHNYDSSLLGSLFTNREHHSHLTRNSLNYRLPFCHKSETKSSISYIGISVWNELPADIKNRTSLGSFKYKLKKYLLNLN